jgi:hypothetical protein
MRTVVSERGRRSRRPSQARGTEAAPQVAPLELGCAEAVEEMSEEDERYRGSSIERRLQPLLSAVARSEPHLSISSIHPRHHACLSRVTSRSIYPRHHAHLTLPAHIVYSSRPRFFIPPLLRLSPAGLSRALPPPSFPLTPRLLEESS